MIDPNRIEAILEKVQKAPRYTGGEMNTTVKAWDSVPLHYGFCFPDTYEVGMSHLGMKILYGLVNQEDWAVCERFFMPWTDMMELMRENEIPLFSMESRRALCEFDMIGFTLQYEMSYTNILAMMDLGGVHLMARERTREEPIVVAGGPCAFNPEPLADFIDAYMIGDGEESTLEVCRTILQWKQSGADRMACLKALAGIEGVYVPALYDVTYHEDGTIASFSPNCPEAPATIRKRVVVNLNDTYYPREIPVPYTEIVHDRIMLEIMRGCTRGCRFCQAGMLYRPIRERSIARLLELAGSLEKATGYEDISLSSLSSGDYTCLAELIRELFKRFKEEHVSISLPSLRIDSVLKESLEETQQERKTSLTFAPEAGTQRLRDVINKGVTEEDLIEKVTDAFEGGWSSVKLYFMIGLPTETEADLDGMVDLASKVIRCYFEVPKDKRAKGLRVTVSASSFVPKPFTPFQWEPQDTQEMLREKQAYLKERLRKVKGVNFNYHESGTSLMEACFARGDRRLGAVLLRAYARGCMLDGWTEQFRFDEWVQAFADCGLDIGFYAFRRRDRNEILPWDMIDAGVTKAFLWREYEKSQCAEVTPDCRKGCHGCGIQRWKGVCHYAGVGRV
ncbi:MAG: TIGR03960 family B12-binding radical SAM protein [Clostridia bacterium]|nr:TIGR03960 family B12-binding radical SAM protein [Clostridia bacterium]